MTDPALAWPKDAKGTVTKQRRATSKRRRADETAVMNRVRNERVVCHIPRCPCSETGAAPEVAHRQHRGMGGNPAGDRTVPEDLFLLCHWRHKGSPMSLDRKTLLMVGDGAAAIPMVLAEKIPTHVYVPRPHLIRDGVAWVRIEDAVAEWLRAEWRLL